MEIAGKTRISIRINGTKALDLSAPTDEFVLPNTEITWTHGTGLNQAEVIWHDERTLANGVSELLDLSEGLVDAYGDPVAFRSITAIYIHNGSVDASLLVGGLVINAWRTWFLATTELALGPNGHIYADSPIDGWQVVNDEKDQLSFEHDGTGSDPLTYRIMLLGRTTEP